MIAEPESAGFILSEEIRDCTVDLQNLLTGTQTTLDLLRIAEHRNHRKAIRMNRQHDAATGLRKKLSITPSP